MPGFQKCSWWVMTARRWKFVLIWLNLIICVVIWFYGTHLIFLPCFIGADTEEGRGNYCEERKNRISAWYGSGSNQHFKPVLVPLYNKVNHNSHNNHNYLKNKLYFLYTIYNSLFCFKILSGQSSCEAYIIMHTFCKVANLLDTL